MRSKKIASFNFYIILSIFCLLFIRYFEVNINYKLPSQLLYLLLCIYEFIAIPGFYFFTASYVTAIIIVFMDININKFSIKLIKNVMMISLSLYVLFMIANISKIISIHFVGLLSIYSVIFIVLGCLFALITTKNISRKER